MALFGHHLSLAREDEFIAILVALTTDVTNADIPTDMADCLATTTIVVLLKKDAQEIQKTKETTGEDFSQPSCPLAMSCPLGKLTCDSVLLVIKKSIAIITDNLQ